MAALGHGIRLKRPLQQTGKEGHAEVQDRAAVQDGIKMKNEFDLKFAFYVCVLVAVIASIIMVGEGVM